MADIQKYFEQFHSVIRVDYDMASELRDKRDIVLGRIRDHLHTNGRPSFHPLHQGSYIMKTGVKPIAELEYDIDVGLRFSITASQFEASEVRSWILEAVGAHTKSVENKNPCIRVNYQKGYHLDVVTYAVGVETDAEDYALAHRSNGWRPADPPGLLEYVDSYRTLGFADTDDSATKTDQFRRCVRYLRRWNDVCLPYDTKAKPSGLALVLLAIQRCLSKTTFLDGRCDDRRALESLARSAATTMGRIAANKPTPEYEDLFGKLSDKEMGQLTNRFRALANALQAAGETTDPVEACKIVRAVLGDDFPVPEPEDTARKTRAPAIVPSSSSA